MASDAAAHRGTPRSLMVEIVLMASMAVVRDDLRAPPRPVTRRQWPMAHGIGKENYLWLETTEVGIHTTVIPLV